MKGYKTMIDEQIAQFRHNYKLALNNYQYWERNRKNNKRKYVKEYYFAAAQEQTYAMIAQDLGIELYDEDFKLIGE